MTNQRSPAIRGSGAFLIVAVLLLCFVFVASANKPDCKMFTDELRDRINTALTTSVEQIEKALVPVNKDITAFGVQITTKEATIEKNKKFLETAESTIKRNDAEIAMLEQELRIVDLLIEKMGDLKTLTGETRKKTFDLLAGLKKHILDTIAQLKQSTTTLTKQSNDAVSENATFQTQIVALKKQVTSLQATKTTHEASIAEYKKAVESITKTPCDMIAILEKLKDKNLSTQLLEQIQYHIDNWHVTLEDLAAVEKEVSKIVVTLGDLKEAVTNLDRREAQNTKVAQDQHKDLTVKINDLVQQVALVDQKRENGDKQTEEIAKKQTALEKTINKIDSEHKTVLNSLESELSLLKEKYHTVIVSDGKTDLGTVINKGLSEHKFLNVIIKRGVTVPWEQIVSMPRNRLLNIVGEGFENGAHNIAATITMKAQYTYQYEKTVYRVPARLIVSTHSEAIIHGVKIVEDIKDSRPLTPQSSTNALFTIAGEYATFTLMQSYIFASEEQIANVAGHFSGRIKFGWTYFHNTWNKYTQIPASANSGWNFAGNTAYVSNSHCSFVSGKLAWSTSSRVVYLK